MDSVCSSGQLGLRSSSAPLPHPPPCPPLCQDGGRALKSACLAGLEWQTKAASPSLCPPSPLAMPPSCPASFPLGRSSLERHRTSPVALCRKVLSLLPPEHFTISRLFSIVESWCTGPQAAAVLKTAMPQRDGLMRSCCDQGLLLSSAAKRPHTIVFK